MLPQSRKVTETPGPQVLGHSLPRLCACGPGHRTPPALCKGSKFVLHNHFSTPGWPCLHHTYFIDSKMLFHEGANGLISLFRSIDKLCVTGACSPASCTLQCAVLTSKSPPGIECCFASALEAWEMCHTSVCLIVVFRTCSCLDITRPSKVQGKSVGETAGVPMDSLGPGIGKNRVSVLLSVRS